MTATRNRRWRTALIGFGRMGQGYADDPVMARHYRYAAHAQVLADHPRFDWRAVVDPDPAARATAGERWPLATAATVADLPNAAEIEVAVIATPPDSRMAMIEHLPGLKAVLVEKPLGADLAGAEAFLAACAARDILVQVNLWRRADQRLREWAGGGLETLVGAPRAVTGWYGNGLLNNGTHAVDLARMLFGEIASVQRIGGAAPLVEGPIPGDDNPTFALTMTSGLTAVFQPLRFADYRENGLSIWGAAGRLDLFNEGLTLHHFPRIANRAMQGEGEVAADAPVALASTVGHALYRMYDNLGDALSGDGALWSPGASALASAAAVEAIRNAPGDGRMVAVSGRA